MSRNVTLVTTLLVVLLLSGCGVTPGPGPIDDDPGTAPEAAPGHPVVLGSQDQEQSASFELENISDETLDWTIEVSNDEDNPEAGRWFSIDPQQGRLGPFESEVVTLTLDPGLEPGRYHSVLEVVYQGGVTAFDVIGEVLPGDGEPGDGSIEGELRTDNALIPLTPPSGFASRSATAGELAASHEQPEFKAGELIVGLEPSARLLSAEGEDPLASLAERYGLELISRDEANGTAVLRGARDPEALAAQLEADAGVSYVEPNYLFYPHALPNDPLLDEAWQLPIVGAPVAWQAPLDRSDGPIVAVIDSGIDLDHEDLEPIFVSNGFDFCASSGCNTTDPDARPDTFSDWHGTHVTGLLAAVAGNARGTAGVAGEVARVVPIKVFHNGVTTAQALANSIRWAAGLSVSGAPTNPYPADIITLSLGAAEDSQLVRNAVEAATDAGSLLIASAGNQGERGVDYPARYPDVLGVGAVNSAFERSCFSDYGTGLDLMAPGGDGFLPISDCSGADDEALLSTIPGNDYGLDAGTSMAAPLVAGAATLVWAQLSDPDPDAVRQRLLGTAFFDGSYMSEERYGEGILRVDRALGFPGPGDEAAVQATGPSTALDTVTLELDGTSTTFLLDGLAPGVYTVAADAAGERYALDGAEEFQLNESQDLDGVAVPLER